MDTTREPRPDEAPPATASWGVMIAYHPDPAQVGTRLAVEVDAPLAIGRAPGLFDDRTMSRNHARISVGARGLEIEDVGSRNGTFVNGEPVQRQTLRVGDLIGAGELLLLALADADPKRSATAVLQAAIERVAPLATPVLFTGETGVGKGHFARVLHRASGRGELVPVACGAVASDHIAEELFGLDAAAHPPGRPGLLERADGGTLLLDDADDAPAQFQSALLAFLEDGRVRRMGGVELVPVDVRVVATARTPEGLREEFLSRLSRFVLRVPPLRERLEDIPVLIRDLLSPLGVWTKRALVAALLRHEYRHNVRELAGLIERAVIDAGADKLVGLSRGVAERMGLADVGSPGALAIASDGSWFRPPGAPRVNLGRRENLARLLRALVAAHRDQPGQALTTEALFAAGWPGERIQGPAASGRVYVGLTTLRNLGLRHFLRRSQGGYLLDSAAKIESIGPS